MLSPLHTVCGSFHSTATELSGCGRDRPSHKARSTGVGNRRVIVVHMRTLSLLLYIAILITVLFSIRATVNLRLPTPVFTL